jgi:hypothetical protein
MASCINLTRRELITGFGLLTLTPAADLLTESPHYTSPQATRSGSVAVDRLMPGSVAGICFVDSRIALAATVLAREASPPYLFNHVARTYLFSALIAKARQLRFDEELLYLACILHDLGLTERFMGDLPFEIQGAQAASRFLDERGFPKAGSALVWNAIAMHASPIGAYQQPEIALVGEGAGADVVSPDFSEISEATVKEVITAFPRLGFKEEFVKTCADLVRKHPRGASRSFMMRDIGERYVPEFHPTNICDLILKAPFKE